MAAVKAVLLGLALSITAVCGWTLMTLPCLPLVFISVPAYRFMNDCSLQLWYKVVPVRYTVLYCITSLCCTVIPHYCALTISLFNRHCCCIVLTDPSISRL